MNATPRRRLRIAVVSETYPPEINGVARTIGTMVRTLSCRGHSIQLVRPRQHPRDHRDIEPGINTVLTRGIPLPRYAGLRMGLPARRALLRVWSERRPDIVQVITEGPLGSSAVSAARQLGIPVASEFHTNFHLYSKHYGLGLLTRFVAAHLRRLHNRADCTLVPTAQMKELLMQDGYNRLRVIGRGIDTSSFSPMYRSANLRRAWGAGVNDVVALYVGRVAAEKNMSLFIEAIRAMQEVTARLRVVVVGDGPELSALRASQPEFVYAGKRHGEDLAQHYASADAFIFPSLTETFGNVTTEAMASGLAVVAFDYAAARLHITHRSNGLLAPCDRTGKFIELAQELAADPLLRQRLSNAAPAVTRELGWDRIVDELELVFHQLIASAGPRPADLVATTARTDHAPL